MINHQYKLIFLHIPRTGGTSIENAICGKDWFDVHAPSKHLTAHSAKKIYAEYWDKYLKFTFVRNPWDRMVSMLKYEWFYGVKINQEKKILLDDYFDKFKKVEYDERFFNSNQFNDYQYIENSVYRNIIGDDMDFIGKFENLQEDFERVCKLVGLPASKLSHIEKSQNRKKYQEYYTEETKNLIYNKFKKEIKQFNYLF